MTTALLTHLACLDHRPGPDHPESPARLSSVLSGLAGREFLGLARADAPPAPRIALETAHTPAHVAAILDRFGHGAAEGLVRVDGDTAMSAGSAEAALRAAGAATAAVDLVMAGAVRNAFCAVRPPGHHAEKAQAMGFCLFNNVAVGAFHARAAHGLQRVAVVDFDVHHGNGTQNIAWSDPDFFYASSHQFPLYPGTGSKAETGAVGNVVNAPLPPGASGPEFRQAWESRIFPALAAFAPDFLFISAGFDGHRADPLANMQLDESDFAWVTGGLCEIARDACKGRVVSALEGGYDLDALRRSSAAHVRALMEA